MLPEGHRLHVVLEGISRGFSAVNIRKFIVRAARLHDLVGLGSLTPAAAAFLDASVRAGLNVLVAGGTQAGKTTMLNCLAAAIPGVIGWCRLRRSLNCASRTRTGCPCRPGSPG